MAFYIFLKSSSTVIASDLLAGGQACPVSGHLGLLASDTCASSKGSGAASSTDLGSLVAPASVLDYLPTSLLPRRRLGPTPLKPCSSCSRCPRSLTWFHPSDVPPAHSDSLQALRTLALGKCYSFYWANLASSRQIKSRQRAQRPVSTPHWCNPKTGPQAPQTHALSPHARIQTAHCQVHFLPRQQHLRISLSPASYLPPLWVCL